MFLPLTILLPCVSAGGIQRQDSLITPASTTETLRDLERLYALITK